MQRITAGIVLALCALAAQTRPGLGQSTDGDAVEALRQLLKNRQPAAGQAEAATLARAAASLKSVGELRLALTLAEWQDNDILAPPAAQVHAKVRNDIGKRLLREIQKSVAADDEVTRLAAAEFLGSLGTVRGTNRDEKGGFGREAVPLVLELCKDRSARVRAAAGLALGRINPQPTLAALGFETLLKDKEVAVRQAASEGSRLFVAEISQRERENRAQVDSVHASPQDVIAAAKAAMGVLPIAMADGDALVRRRGQETVKAAALAAFDLVPVPPDFLDGIRALPPGSKLNADQQRVVNSFIANVEEVRQLLHPLLEAMQAHASIEAGLKDLDDSVTRTTAESVEALAMVRQRLRALYGSVPQAGTGAPPQLGPDYLQDQLGMAVPVLAKMLTHKLVDNRLAGLYALETMETDAAPAAAAVTKAIDDDNPFVRWAAARTLGRMGPADGANAGPQVMALARHLTDESSRVRNASAAALLHLGPAASSAIPLMGEALGKGDDAQVELLLAALKKCGPQAKSAVPAIVDVLKSREKSAGIRIAAARVLGGLGSEAIAARAALQEALSDAETGIRQAAAEALLAIPPKTK
jgi:HEAT repeat protein